MGFKNYFRNKPAVTSSAADQSAVNPAGPGIPNILVPSLPVPPNYSGNGPYSPPLLSSRASSSRIQSSSSSAFIDDIKHEVMVNWLYQQLTAKFWINTEGDGSRNSFFGAAPGTEEGVLLKKSKNNYMACPPGIGRGVFAQAASTLNVQVCCLFPATDRVPSVAIPNL